MGPGSVSFSARQSNQDRLEQGKEAASMFPGCHRDKKHTTCASGTKLKAAIKQDLLWAQHGALLPHL